jgi:hypothetical protein
MVFVKIPNPITDSLEQDAYTYFNNNVFDCDGDGQTNTVDELIVQAGLFAFLLRSPSLCLPFSFFSCRWKSIPNFCSRIVFSQWQSWAPYLPHLFAANDNRIELHHRWKFCWYVH